MSEASGGANNWVYYTANLLKKSPRSLLYPISYTSKLSADWSITAVYSIFGVNRPFAPEGSKVRSNATTLRSLPVDEDSSVMVHI